MSPPPAGGRHAVVSEARLTWLGHSTVLVELDGVRLLTDPVLGRRVTYLRRHAPVLEAPRDLDAVLVSHAHWDHLDVRTLGRLGRSLPVVLPRGAGGLLRRRGFKRVVELDAGEETTFGSVVVHAVPAEHDASRGPLGLRSPSLGFVISGSRTIYFAGDTDLFAGMTELAPAVDAALLPVAGWGPRLPPGHLDPHRAAIAAGRVRPRLAVPIHWGTLAPLWAKPEEEAPLAFEREVRTLAPEVEVRILPVGGSTRF
jgi:L-ascorbate metabolism protein UlaG (beta-lactamase superfamily)